MHNFQGIFYLWDSLGATLDSFIPSCETSMLSFQPSQSGKISRIRRDNMEFGDSTTRNALQKLVLNEKISEQELRDTFEAIMRGKATSAQSAAFIIMLKTRGETARELAVLSQVANEHAEPCFRCEDAVDIVGTGGDGMGTFNISTAAALIVAGAGVKVIKVYICTSTENLQITFDIPLTYGSFPSMEIEHLVQNVVVLIYWNMQALIFIPVPKYLRRFLKNQGFVFSSPNPSIQDLNGSLRFVKN